MIDERERWIEQVRDLADESTKSGAIDVALRHYILDHHNKSQVADQLPTKLVDELHTPQLPISRETNVGRDSD